MLHAQHVKLSSLPLPPHSVKLTYSECSCIVVSTSMSCFIVFTWLPSAMPYLYHNASVSCGLSPIYIPVAVLVSNIVPSLLPLRPLAAQMPTLLPHTADLDFVPALCLRTAFELPCSPLPIFFSLFQALYIHVFPLGQHSYNSHLTLTISSAVERHGP
jgi:hypothetical protein